MNKKIGIFGGTFDPIHMGHMQIANYCKEKLVLDEVLFIPASVSPLKSQEKQSSISSVQRLELLRAAIRNYPEYKIDTCEMDKGGISFTVDTIKYLLERSGNEEYYLIIGEDNAREFSRWKYPDEILSLVYVVVYRREAIAKVDLNISKKYRDKMQHLESPLIRISSSDIRKRIKQGKDIKNMVPESVEKLISERGYYL